VNSSVPTSQIIIYLFPIIVIEFGLMIAALINLIKRPVERIRWNNKLPWILIILFINLIGPISYFVFGRIEGEPGAGSGD
jgi:hypothetical protein